MRLFTLFYIAIFISCQDTKTTEKTPVETPEKIIEKKPELEVISKPNIPEKITDENVVEFLTEYGKNNLETKVRLTTRLGVMEIELYNETPLHRANFIHITKRKFLDETCFYRVSKDFVIQGGNSDREEMADIKNAIGSFTIPREIKSHLKHRYASVAMARGYENNPARRSSPYEFYIVVNNNSAKHLNNEHTIIGRVTKGMDVAKKINNLKVNFSEWPERDVYMKAEVIE